MTYYGRGGSSYNSSKSKEYLKLKCLFIDLIFLKGSYGSSRNNGNERDRHGGNNLLDDLDSFVVGPLRPGPPVIKNFYTESPLILNRPQVFDIKIFELIFSSLYLAYYRSILCAK